MTEPTATAKKPAPPPSGSPPAGAIRKRIKPTPRKPRSEIPARIIQLQQEVKYLEFSRDLTREFVRSTGSMKKVMDELFKRVLEVMEAEAGSLWLFEARSGQNICHLAEGPAKKKILGLRLPKGEGIVGQVIERNQPEVVLDCTEDERFASQVDQRTGFNTASLICTPLSDGDEAFGAIQIVNKKSGLSKRFSDDDRRLVEDLARAAGVAVRNARLLESESRVKEMHTLMEVSGQVVSTLDLDQVLVMTVNLAGELAEVSSGAVALLDETKDTLFLAALSGGRPLDPKDPTQITLLGFMEQVRKAGRTSYVADVVKYRKQSGDKPNAWADYLEEHEMKSAWVTPLTDDEGTLGVLFLESEQAYFAAKGKADMLFILANQATVALRNASLFQKIPFAAVLGKMGEGSKRLISGWRRTALIGLMVVGIVSGLHYLPIFRSVSGPCLVESRFGRGIYLEVAGRISTTHVKEGDWVNAGDHLASLDDTPIHLRLVDAESKLAILDRQIIEAKAASDTSAMSRATIERFAAQAEARQARLDMQKVKIRAPMSGIVLTPRPAELIGREFAVGSEILRLADPGRFTVMVEIPEEDVLDIQPGQPVRGVLRSRPGQGFRGEVVHVGRAFSVPVEALEEGVMDTTPPEGFAAEVKVLQSDVTLRPGMTGQAEIATPETSILVRFMRRMINAYTFWFGG
ncbi:MAG: GAF domain-containing protein [Magnetococcales bacterium]|nr:GAF domain-containing protein [Magnetococcales bacterium]